MIRELADYERSLDSVQTRPADLHAALFGPQPTAHAHVAEQDGALVGMALWFVTFSTWTGRPGIYLEDLFVRPAYRGGGHGRALLRALAEQAVRRGYSRLEWAVLDWNEPAMGFYRRLGATAKSDWTVWRLAGADLRAVAGRGGRGRAG